MNLGLTMGYWGIGPTPADQLKLVREAERLGFDSAWAAEAYGSDAVSVLSWLASQTKTLRLGSAVMQMPARTPAMTAMTAATIDQLSAGRFILGLGSSGPQVSEGWHGVPFARQLQRTREYVEIVRKALDRERLTYEGEIFNLPLPDGPGKALKLTITPNQSRVPVYLAALGPKNTALAGEIADGWIPVLFSPEHVEVLRSHLQSGLDRGGRKLVDIDIAPMVNVVVTDDLEAGRDVLRPFLALYIGGMGSRRQNFYVNLVSEYGFADAAHRVQDLYLDGHKREAEAALPGELIDAVSIVGPPAVVRERLRGFRAAGVGTLMCSAVAATSVDDKIDQLRRIADLAADAA